MRPETGYGYLELSENSRDIGTSNLKSFVEKPSLDQAEQMLAAAFFMECRSFCSAKDMIDAFKEHVPT